MYITNFTPEQLVYERRWRIWIVLIVDAIELFACFRRPETFAQTLFVIGAVYVNLHILFNYGYATRETSLDKGTQRKTTENELPSLTQCTA